MRWMFTLFLAVLVISCQPPKKNSDNELLRVKSQLVETFNNNIVESEFVEYVYDSDSDVFWSKALYKDSTGTVIKYIERSFDENKMPKTEITKEMDIISSTVVTKYDPNTYLVVEKTTYDGELKEENKKAEYKYHYIAAVLVSQEVTKYSQDADFKNIEGNKITSKYKLRFLPDKKYLPKGNQPVIYFVEYSTDYLTKDIYDEIQADKKATKEEKSLKPGMVFLSTITKFDDEGLPVYTFTTKPDCEHDADRQWFVAEKNDKGQLIALTGYSNEKCDSLTDLNTKITFTYENDKVKSVEDNKYNSATKKFDRFHDSKIFKWYDFGFDGPINNLYQFAEKKSEHYCYGAVRYSLNDTKIKQFDKNKIVVEEYSGFYDGPFTERKTDTKLSKKTEITFAKLKNVKK